jgi:hypothetical protein
MRPAAGASISEISPTNAHRFAVVPSLLRKLAANDTGRERESRNGAFPVGGIERQAMEDLANTALRSIIANQQSQDWTR